MSFDHFYKKYRLTVSEMRMTSLVTSPVVCQRRSIISLDGQLLTSLNITVLTRVLSALPDMTATQSWPKALHNNVFSRRPVTTNSACLNPTTLTLSVKIDYTNSSYWKRLAQIDSVATIFCLLMADIHYYGLVYDQGTNYKKILRLSYDVITYKMFL